MQAARRRTKASQHLLTFADAVQGMSLDPKTETLNPKNCDPSTVQEVMGAANDSRST